MTRRSFTDAVYLKCFAFVMLLAASDVGAEEGGNVQARKPNGVVGGVAYNRHSVCYDIHKKEVSCTKQRAIIVGTVIGSLFVLLLALYLYATCTERRKKRTRSPIVEENEPLSNGTVNSSDLEKGVTKADDDDFMHPDKSDEASVSRTSSTVPDPSSFLTPPVYRPLETSDFGHPPPARS